MGSPRFHLFKPVSTSIRTYSHILFRHRSAKRTLAHSPSLSHALSLARTLPPSLALCIALSRSLFLALYLNVSPTQRSLLCLPRVFPYSNLPSLPSPSGHLETLEDTSGLIPTSLNHVSGISGLVPPVAWVGYGAPPQCDPGGSLFPGTAPQIKSVTT